MNSAQEQTITTLDSKTQDMIVKLTPFSEARLLESLVTKQHFVLIAARNVDELSDDDGNLIASQIGVCQHSCHPHPNNLNGGKGDNHGTIQSRTQTSNIKQTAIA